MSEHGAGKQPEIIMITTATLHSNGIPPNKCDHYARLARYYRRRSGAGDRACMLMARAAYHRDSGYNWHAAEDQWSVCWSLARYQA